MRKIWLASLPIFFFVQLSIVSYIAVFIGGSPSKKAEVWRVFQLDLARKAMEKRKGEAAEGSIAKRVKSVLATRTPVLTTGGSSGTVVSEKPTAPTVVVDATQVNFSLPSGVSLESGGQVPPVPTFHSSKLPPSGGCKGKGQVGPKITTVNFTIPSNFMANVRSILPRYFPLWGNTYSPLNRNDSMTL